MGHGKFSLGAEISGIFKSLHIVHMIPMQMSEDADINILRMYPHVLQKSRALDASSFLTFMMVPGCSLFIGKSGIDHNLVLTGINVKAQSRVPNFLTRLPFPEQICPYICFEPASVDWIYSSIFLRHLWSSVIEHVIWFQNYSEAMLG